MTPVFYISCSGLQQAPSELGPAGISPTSAYGAAPRACREMPVVIKPQRLVDLISDDANDAASQAAFVSSYHHQHTP